MVICLEVVFLSALLSLSYSCPLISSTTPYTPCSPNTDTCAELCGKGTLCAENGACMCSKEPSASTLGGSFTHCTNFDYVEQKSCTKTCSDAGKTDHRVCWTCGMGNYCACFDQPKKP